MRRIFRPLWVRLLAVAMLVFVVVVFGFGIYVASQAGALPWQTEPTRVAVGITPFAGIPGFGAPTPTPSHAAAQPTPAP